MSAEPFRTQIQGYYAETYRAHGDSPRGVDWNSEAGQRLRFHHLVYALDLQGAPRPFSILDVGCGTGALLDHLRGCLPPGAFRYTGVDYVPEMISRAQEKAGADPAAHFLCSGLQEVSAEETERFDYVVASGIFNVKQDVEDGAWEVYVQQLARAMYQRASRGVAFNCLTDLVDFRAARLFYADPAALLRWAMTHLSRYARLDQGYPLYEFTLAVLREDFVRRAP